MFKVGDEVMATGYRPDGIKGSGMPLDRGRVYIVASVGVVESYETIVLEGFPNDRREDGFYAAIAFRKVERKTETLTRWLSQPVGDTDKFDKSKRRVGA